MDKLTDDVPGCYYNRTVQFFYEQSGKNISAHWRPRDYVVVSLGMGVSVIVILANILVMVAIFINRRFHFPIYYLLGRVYVCVCQLAAAPTNLPNLPEFSEVLVIFKSTKFGK